MPACAVRVALVALVLLAERPRQQMSPRKAREKPRAKERTAKERAEKERVARESATCLQLSTASVCFFMRHRSRLKQFPYKGRYVAIYEQQICKCPMLLACIALFVLAGRICSPASDVTCCNIRSVAELGHKTRLIMDWTVVSEHAVVCLHTHLHNLYGSAKS